MMANTKNDYGNIVTMYQNASLNWCQITGNIHFGSVLIDARAGGCTHFKRNLKLETKAMQTIIFIVLLKNF